MKTIMVAAPQSGSGKTTITLGIMETMRRRGLSVAPFKVGPDFIDPGYHRLVTGRTSLNLDGWILSEETVRSLFERHSFGADVAVIEGVMGLFDGIDGVHEAGSTAQIAKILGAPVILVIDARSQARSVAALVKGYATFDPDVWIRGVIFNNVGSDNHARVLKSAVESLDLGIPVLGSIPREERLTIPSRHLGLFTADEEPLSPSYLDHLAEVMRQRLDFGMIWAAGGGSVLGEPDPLEISCRVDSPRARIAVARDLAFSFVYETNLRLLEEAGGEIVPFSPLTDPSLPEGVDGLYLPGGYPELFAEQLAENRSLIRQIRGLIRKGLPTYGECGGFIYLTRGVRSSLGVMLGEFVGIFPVETTMLTRRKGLGYREVELRRDTIIGPAGTVIRGHEFHYSEMEDMPRRVPRVYSLRKPGIDLGSEGFVYKNCLGSYVHLHFGSNPAAACAFVDACEGWRKGVGKGSP